MEPKRVLYNTNDIHKDLPTVGYIAVVQTEPVMVAATVPDDIVDPVAKREWLEAHTDFDNTPIAFAAPTLDHIREWLNGFIENEFETRHPDNEIVVTIVAQAAEGISHSTQVWVY